MSLLATVALVLTLLEAILPKLSGNPAYAGVVKSLEAAIAELQSAHGEMITKQELEALRTAPKW